VSRYEAAGGLGWVQVPVEAWSWGAQQLPRTVAASGRGRLRRQRGLAMASKARPLGAYSEKCSNMRERMS
jgi:hypothetical protein